MGFDWNKDLERFSEKYEEALRVLLDGKLLTEVSKKEAKEIRKLAREEAFKVAPILRSDLDAYQAWLQVKRYSGEIRDMNSREQRGAKVLNRMGQICLKNFHPPWTRKKKQKATELPPGTGYVPDTAKKPSTTLTQKYLAWIKEHDTVPPDDTLSFFLGCVNTNWSNARREAKDLGYEFERVDGGMWQVTGRPLLKVEELDETEKDRLLRRVISMEGLSDSEVVSILRKLI